MSKTKSTKSALLMSFTSLLLCFAMLIGSTFAWFTDSATASVNTIQSGTLDVALEMKNADGSWSNAEGQTLSWVKAASAPANEQVLWEPGCTYELPELRIVNKGNLALKYKIAISGIQGDAELNDVIEWTINDTALDADHSLAAGASATLTIKGHMMESAGNDYQGKFIDNIAITVVATQDTAEFDSTTDQYDADATYPVAVAANVVVGDNNKVTEQVIVQSAEKVGSTDTPVAKVTVPAEAAVLDGNNQLTLTVDEVATPANIEVAAGTDTKTFEVDMKGLDKNSNTALFKVELYVGTGLTGFSLKHNGAYMTKVNALSAVSNDQDYYYDSATGVVTFLTGTFSPFTAVYDKDSWSNHAAESYATPVDTSAKVVTIASAEELALFAQESSNYNNYTVNITENIDLGDYTWKPIAAWNGTFNGNHHVISNLLVCENLAYGSGFFSKFGSSGTAIMNDLTFENATVMRNKAGNSGNGYAVIAGYAAYYGSAEFHNVTVRNSYVAAFGKVAAFAGMVEMQGGTIVFDNCHIENVTIRSGYNGAGFAGIIHNNVSGDSNTAIFNDCTVDVTFDCYGIMGDGAEGVTVEGFEGKYTVYNGTWYYAESAKYFNEYNAPGIREDMDAIVHNTPYNMGTNS